MKTYGLLVVKLALAYVLVTLDLEVFSEVICRLIDGSSKLILGGGGPSELILETDTSNIRPSLEELGVLHLIEGWNSFSRRR